MEQNLQTDDKNRKEYPLTDIVKLDDTNETYYLFIKTKEHKNNNI